MRPHVKLSDDRLYVRPAARGQHLLIVSIHSLTFDLKHKSTDYSSLFQSASGPPNLYPTDFSWK